MATLTLGENIGDLGGPLKPNKAYHLRLDGKENKVIDGLTADPALLSWSWAVVAFEEPRRKAIRAARC